MSDRLQVLIVDDDQDMIDLISALLEFAGYQVITASNGLDATSKLENIQPDVILLDVMMPGINGFELCEQLRADADFAEVTIIFVSQKNYDYDLKRARQIGANGFISKPIVQSEFLSQIERIVEDRVELAFWGVHGTLPTPGERFMRYGGNTSCVTLEFSSGDLLIFDAGTGIKALSDNLMGRNAGRVDATIMLSHPHWDHINALPFFAPFFVKGNRFDIFGPAQGSISIEQQLAHQMDGVYFPITPVEFSATIGYRDLGEESLLLRDITVHSMFLNHPGACLGYRIEYKDRSVCYITDNELYPEDSEHYNEKYVAKLADFVRETDALIIDSTYTDEGYPSHMHWGHSPISEVVKLAHRAEAKQLYLFHHDSDQTDDDIDAKLESAQNLLNDLGSSTNCVAPGEGFTVRL